MTEKLGALLESLLINCKMKILDAKRLNTAFQKILPFSAVPTTVKWLADSVAYLPFLQDVHKFKRHLKDHAKLLMSEVAKKRLLHYSELLSKVKGTVATAGAFLKWKAGQTNGMIGRTVAKVAACSEGVLVDEIEALDVLPAVAAVNDSFKTCIFVGDGNQKFQRRGRSPGPFRLAIGTAHGAASDVENEELPVNSSYRPRERGISDWLNKDNGNIEHLSGLTLCKRCGPAITSFLSSAADCWQS